MNSKRSIIDKIWSATSWSILEAMSNAALLSVIEDETTKLQNVKSELR
ncbi:MAG: hypothetical protein ACLRU1_07865 [Veillonella parvula]